MSRKTHPTLAAQILIVEDSPTQALQLQHTLERHGYRVAVAPDGKAALALVREQRPTLVVSDVLMPEVDGYQLCRQIKAEADFKDTPVILLTTLAEPEDIIRGLECGADAFITKPYEDHYLLARIQHFLANQELRKGEQGQPVVEIIFAGRKHAITSDRLQILNLLLSVYEGAVHKNRELLKVQEALQRLNEELEARNEDLRRYSRELEAANKELDAFGYSIAHDLRAPLRAVHGFASILLEDYAAYLPASGQRYLQDVKDNVIKLDQLIQTLLSFSRFSRQPLKRQPVALTALVRHVLEELRDERAGRRVEITVHDLPPCHGDPALLKQVFLNFLTNALKFTRRREVAHIEIGCRQTDGETVYFVKDDGVGFDMRYASKLFGVFQRLHSAEEYKGTGAGLAIVQRIIHRHGGRVWAKAAVNRGATFYFTLGEGPAPRGAAGLGDGG